MPTEFWYPPTGATHDLNNDAWQKVGGNANAATRPGGGRLGAMTHDDASSYISSLSSSWQDVNIDWPSPMGFYDGVLTATWRQRGTAGTSLQRLMKFRRPGGATNGDIYNITNTVTTYVTQALLDVSGTGHNPDGVAWGTADFDDEASTNMSFWTDHNASNARVTSVWGQISFSPPTKGGFVFLLGLLPPLVGHFVFRADFERFLSWRRLYHPRHTILTGAEVQQAWEELRAHRHPKFFLPATAEHPRLHQLQLTCS